MSVSSQGHMTEVRAARVCLAGLQYFAMVFAAGFALGVLRVLLLEPQFGARWAELAEMPFMMLAIVFAARWIVRSKHLSHVAEPLVAGLLALALLLITEAVVVVEVRGISISDYVHSRDAVAGPVYLIMLYFFAIFPAMSDVVFPRDPPR